MRARLCDAKRIIIKLGTKTVVNSDGTFAHGMAKKLVMQIHALHKAGKECIVVSSGAIALGNKRLGWERSKDVVLEQTAASVGQGILLHAFTECANEFDIPVSQVLVTYDDLENEKRKANMKNVINKLLENKFIPIINENDSIANEEITFGDNDILAATLVPLVDADALIILSHIDGVYKKNGHTEIIDHVQDVEKDTEGMVTEESSDTGRGGMKSKLMAAQKCIDINTPLVLASSSKENVLLDIMGGKQIGTLFAK